MWKNLFVLRPWLNYPFRALWWIISMCLEHKWFVAAWHYSIDFITSPCSHILFGVPCQRVREFRAKLAATIKHVKAYVPYAVYMCALVIPHHQPLESATPPPRWWRSMSQFPFAVFLCTFKNICRNPQIQVLATAVSVYASNQTSQERPAVTGHSGLSRASSPILLGTKGGYLYRPAWIIPIKHSINNGWRLLLHNILF